MLLVEDSELVRETTIEFLEELGCEVVAVDRAEDALVKLASEGFDLVFTDVSLPGMSGLALVKEARERRLGQRCVISSGYGDIGGSDFGEGVVVLGKPYDLASLEATLDRVLR